MNPARVLLVGYEDQDNLGLRYLSSRLRSAGHAVRLVTVGKGVEPVVLAADRLDPHVIGFSLIFQYLVPEFAELVRAVRRRRPHDHLTMGGHYASFEPEALLGAIPELDSVVRFEGEDALVELAEAVAGGADWRAVLNLAFPRDGGVVTNEIRAGRTDLDELPWPDRADIDYEAQKLPTASMLGSRGCPWRCSFCSIITFYEGNGTRGRRRRDPVRIADELEHLHRERGVSVVLWQDDDFLAGGRAATRWAHDIARECIDRGLDQGLRWKLSCRSDEVKREVLLPLVEAGLTHVYLGVEAGDADDLKDLNKLLLPEVHLRAGEVLRDLEVSFDFGFMLLQPWSTFASVRNNIRFLHELAGDGYATVGFCRMLPYVGTAVEERLLREGRLASSDLFADYAFREAGLDRLYDWLLATFRERNFTASGTQNLLRLLLFESQLRLPDRPVDDRFRSVVRSLASVSNRIALDTLEEAIDRIEEHGGEASDPVLERLRRRHQIEDQRIRGDLAVLLARRPDAMERVNVTR